ncbi:KPN_02809 family neutral zinc metallopeptidase [Corynebacterium tapiri]|uniref:Metalloprotease n=1 Tax=Corynebacterium tapiri TaxID=1448266 RepID=A0A5C4U3T4_9CORY|nr:neutral zinc metallopeptidase [Corynebacterium tapiri]TNL97761.1 metalloprotease [Corynebacterium tapiri]
MTFKNDAPVGGRATRGGSGAMIGAGGGIGGLLLVGLFLLLGGNPSDLDQVTGGQQPGQGAPESTLAECKTIEDANNNPECRVDATAQSVDKVWMEQLPQQAGIEYTKPGIKVFSSATTSGCGRASGATGPFYCPQDESAYFDVSFFQQLEKLGGSDAPLAQMYIVAHEMGHHIQNLEGTLGLSNYNDPGEDSAAVAIELQADCYAGFWAHYADKGEHASLETITKEQLATAIDTARAVGDDNIQERTQGEVNPDQFTHGSSEERQQAFLNGYNSGKMSQCDTLDRGVYKS